MSLLRSLAQRMPKLPQHLLIGLSGGADSVALTLLTVEKLGPDGQITCVHVNHGLRGEASDQDEAFVRSFCREKRLPLLVHHLSLPVPSSENAARDARWACFAESMRDIGAEALLLAHHEEDQAETVLLHLLRGAGLDGLTGMSPDSVAYGFRVLRPLIGFSKRELLDMLAEEKQDWREDGSNTDTRYLRNAIRMRILPELEALSPGAAHRIAQTGTMLTRDADALQEQASEALHRMTDGDPAAPLPITGMLALNPIIRKRVLRLWWHEAEGTDLPEKQLSHDQTEALWETLHGRPSAVCNLPGSRRAYRGYTHLHLLPVSCERKLCTLRIIPEADGSGDGLRCQAIPSDLLQQCVIRTRLPGDRIQPFGAAGHMSLQDYLTNRKVDAPFRDRIPLLANEHEIYFVAGVGAGAIPPYRAGYAMIAAEGPMPWMKPRKEST